MATKKQPPRKMSAKEQRFIALVADGTPQYKAYMEAGYGSTTDKSAQAGAARLLKIPRVRDALNQIMTRATKAAEVTRQGIIDELSRIAFFDVAELYDQDGKLLPPNKLPENIRRALRMVKIIRSDTARETRHEYYFHDKGLSLERLAKIMDMFAPDRSEHNARLTIEIINYGEKPKG